MKITKATLDGMRSAIAAQNGQPQRQVVVYVGDIQALLDERKVLREALRLCIPVGPDGEEMLDLALLGGDDE